MATVVANDISREYLGYHMLVLFTGKGHLYPGNSGKRVLDRSSVIYDSIIYCAFTDKKD